MLNYIQAFLSPDNSHENYAKALGVDASIIKELNEICSVPNLNKETLVTNYKPLDWVLNKNSIYLKK
jgi:phenylacetate-coenzyme A ligase PaaK-like adenylate-forming protein